MLCNHEWEYKSGMDSGHVCVFCGDVKQNESPAYVLSRETTPSISEYSLSNETSNLTEKNVIYDVFSLFF